MKTARLLCLTGILFGFVLSAFAEQLEMFNAMAAPEEAWSWANAKIRKAAGAGLTVTEINKQGDYGSVFPEDRFPYYPDAEIILDVNSVPAGAYTLQVLAFAGESNIGFEEPLKNSTSTGRKVVKLGDLKLPAESQSIAIKIWVTSAEGATTVLDNLRYVVPIDASSALVDERFQTLSDWESADATMESADGGARMTLAADQRFGSILFNRMMARDDNDFLLVHAPKVRSGTITLQIVAFDDAGDYLDSQDAIRAVGAGWHGVRLGQVKWPEGAKQFKVKLWLGGTASASAEFDRLLLIKP